MSDPIIRTSNVAVLLKLEATESVDALPGVTDAVNVEANSVQTSAPFTAEASSEATGSLVGGAPLVIGQPATIRFRSQIKGAGAGVTYSPTVKPPLHQALQACGKRGQFTAAKVTSLCSAGSATSATLNAAHAATAEAYRGMRLIITAGAGAGSTALVSSYSAGRVALLTKTFLTPLDASTSVAINDNWTYSGTSPLDLTARLTDQPSATIYVYRDGKLRKFVACRGTVDYSGNTARAGFADFSFTGIYVGDADAAVPSGLVLPSHSAPILAQSTALDAVVLLNRLPMPISQWSLENGGTLETPDDPNTNNGFGASVITDRIPLLKMDPLATLIAYRNSIADIQGGTLMNASLSCGISAGNRWALTLPRVQKTVAEDGERGKLQSEQITAQARSLSVDAYGRDGDSILMFD
ncbi:hypothetical protein [Sphingomonas profundi]|uniref:hypothetical protein n=1 Tax=Alterirhizorhabdus profundi TaxID=2681549 RepID=UPI0012E96A70|nr:hypothetical protein [Sphingomonas profundi]